MAVRKIIKPSVDMSSSPIKNCLYCEWRYSKCGRGADSSFEGASGGNGCRRKTYGKGTGRYRLPLRMERCLNTQRRNGLRQTGKK